MLRVTLILSLFITGCSTFQSSSPERKLPYAAPKSWETSLDSKPAGNKAPPPALDIYFGSHFPDFNYKPLILSALKGNYALQQLEFNLAVKKGQQQQAKAKLWPALTAGLSGNNKRTENISAKLFALQGNVSWTVDLWGSQKLLYQAAENDAEAAALSWNAARLSVSAAIMQSWFDWQSMNKLQQLQRDFVQSLETATKLVENRFDTGLASFLEVRLAHTETALARTDLLQRKNTAIKARSQFITLLGAGYPFSEESVLPFNSADQTVLPDKASPLPSYLPAEIIRQRPDLLAAERRLKSEELKLLSSKKAWLPSLSLTASAGQQNDTLNNILKDGLSVSAIAFNLMQPIFNAGAIKAQQAQAQALVSTELYVYSEILHKAMVEVNQFIQKDIILKQQLNAAKFAAALADETQSLAERNYNAGLSDLNTFLDTHRNQINTESRWVSTKNEWLQNRINLLLALGASENLFSGTDNNGNTFPKQL